MEFFDTIPKPVSTSQETKKPEAKPETKKPAVSEPAAVTNEKKTEVKKPEKPSSKPKKTEKVKIKMPAQKHFKSPSEPPPPPPPQAKKTSAKDKIDNLKTEELEDVENVEGTEILDDTESTQIVSKAKPPPKPPKIQNIPPPSVPASIPDSKPPSSKQTLSEGDQINVDEIKPSKGSVVQVLTAWGNRIIDSTNFEKSSVTIGSDPSSDIVLPFARGVNHKLLKISSGGAQVIVPNGARGSVVTKTQKLSLEQAAQMGKAGSVSNGTRVSLNQEELVKVDLTERVSLLVRFVPPTIRPMMLPFTGLSAKELTNVIATVGLSIVMAFFFVISEQSELVAKEKDQEEKKQRKALFVYNPPPKPKTKIKPPPPPPPTTMKVVKLKETKKKKQVKAPKKTKVVKRAARSGKANDAPKTKSKSTKKVLTAKNPGKKKGISRGTSPRKAPIDTQKLGLLGVFGKSGTQKSLKNAVDGSGVSSAVRGATGIGSKKAAGSGTVIGEGLNQVGASGKGESTFGIAGVKTRGRGSGNTGYGSGGNIGGKGGTHIEAGGAEEAFEGSMDREAIKRVVQRHLKQLRACYNRVLDKNPSAQGKVVLNWTILAKGRVGKARSVNSEISNKKMLNCMTRRLKAWKFPAPPDGQVGDITYPFIFTQSK